jgi:hypothetical protein
MRKPYLFASLVAIVLAFAGGIIYQFGLPLLNNATIGFGGRTLSCNTGFGILVMVVIAGVAIAIGILWSKFSDS